MYVGNDVYVGSGVFVGAEVGAAVEMMMRTAVGAIVAVADCSFVAVGATVGGRTVAVGAATCFGWAASVASTAF